MHGFHCLHVYQQQRSPARARPKHYITMAYSSRLAWLLLPAMAMAVAFHPAPASAEDYLVGDKAGWTLNYTIGWPEGKIFKVNDSLVFTYTKGKYTVTEVDGQTFRECYRQGNKINEWTSGNDTVTLDWPGRRWFFSSVDDQCEMGLKLFVDVVGSAAPAQPPLAPAPAPGVKTPEPPRPAPSPNTTTGGGQATPPSTPPSSDNSAAALKHYYKVDEAVARAAVVAGAVIAAVLM